MSGPLNSETFLFLGLSYCFWKKKKKKKVGLRVTTATGLCGINILRVEKFSFNRDFLSLMGYFSMLPLSF